MRTLKLLLYLKLCVYLSVERVGGLSNGVRYIPLKAIPCSGVYQPGMLSQWDFRPLLSKIFIEHIGGIYSEYLRSMRLKTKVDIEEGFVKADRELVPSFYLSTDKLETEAVAAISGDETPSYILKEIVPIPIRSARNDITPSILSAMGDQASGSNRYSWTAAVVTDRDRGFFDNLSFIAKSWLKRPDLRKMLFDGLRSGSSMSPYHNLVNILDRIADLKITGLIIEVADSPNELALSLGAAVLVAKKEHSSKWGLKAKNYQELTKEERKSSEAKIIDCFLDEVVGLHLATGLPIYTAESLYRRVSINGLLENLPTGMNIQAPYFLDAKESMLWNKQLEESRARPAKVVKKVNEIPDASYFFKMRLSEKRACLRSSGVLNLPRPREGPKRVDAMMIPLLDEEVAYEVLRRLGETRGDYEMAAKMQDYETRRPLLARLYNEAMRNGNIVRAKELINEMNSISVLYYDPNNPDEVITEGFDIEEWYWTQRKRVYGIIAA